MEETNSATAPLFYLPGWYWYLEDEKDFRELPNAENFWLYVYVLFPKNFE